MTRLITLATTVLSTKLPDLACTYNDIADYTSIREKATDDESQKQNSVSSLNLTNDEIIDAFILNPNRDSEDTHNEITKDLIMSPSPLLISGLENDFAEVKIIDKSPVKTADTSIIRHNKQRPTKIPKFVEKRNEYNHAGNFIEDESGFSSMSSFQEIGIPIISIIPPSPCKEVSHMDDITDIFEDTKWKSDPVLLNKQTVEVFWV